MIDNFNDNRLIIGAMKIDNEGFELYTLEGSLEFILKFTPKYI